MFRSQEALLRPGPRRRCRVRVSISSFRVLDPSRFRGEDVWRCRQDGSLLSAQLRYENFLGADSWLAIACS